MNGNSNLISHQYCIWIMPCNRTECTSNRLCYECKKELLPDQLDKCNECHELLHSREICQAVYYSDGRFYCSQHNDPTAGFATGLLSSTPKSSKMFSAFLLV